MNIVQRSGIKSGQNVNTFNFTPFASLPTVGNGLVLIVSAWNAGDLAFSASNLIDNNDNPYSLDKTFSNNTGHGACAIFRCSRIRASAGSFNMTIGSNKAAGNWFDLAVLEVGGYGGILQLGQTNGGTGGAPTTPFPSGSIDVTEDEQL